MSTPARIGQLARAAGVGVQAVRYYERIGLLLPATRGPNGYRLYGSDAPERLLFIKQAQSLGFTLDEIREILRLKHQGQSPCNCVRDLLTRKLDHLEHEMARLRRFRRDLRRTLQRAQRLPRLPHNASVICPIIQVQSSNQRRGGTSHA